MTSSEDFDTLENDPHSVKLCDQLVNTDATSILSKEGIEDSLGEILNNSQSFEQVASKLNILEKINDKGFYDLYRHMNGVLGHSPQSYTFLGRLWAWGFNNSKEADQDWMCSKYVQNPDFFTPFHALQDILEHLDIEPHKLANWLIDIRKRLGEDMAQAPLSKGLFIIATSKPAIARKVIEIWDNQKLDENTIWMAASLLSHLRGIDQVEKVEIESVAENGNEQQKLIYFRSMM